MVDSCVRVNLLRLSLSHVESHIDCGRKFLEFMQISLNDLSDFEQSRKKSARKINKSSRKNCCSMKVTH